jgi:hypothetical protein
MANYLIPHSSEWFEKLTLQNAHQAMLTGVLIKAAGHDNICSICGDDPASDYVLVDPVPAEGEVSSLRLCTVCRDIRGMQGELFEPATA